MTLLLQCDMSQAELRCQAAFSGDPWLIGALQEDSGDFFDTHMMPVCFPGVDMSTIDAVERKEMRVKVKAVMYGLSFSRGAAAIAASLKIPVRDAQAIIDNLAAVAPIWWNWRELIKEAAVNEDKRDLLTNPFGRRYQREVISSKNMNEVQREALSFLPQSTASDICLMTGILVHKPIKQLGGHIVALVHDAILAEVPEENAEQIGKLISNTFRSVAKDVIGDAVPMLSEYSYGKSWGDLK